MGLAGFAALALIATQVGVDLTGSWEIQSMGGDRQVEIRQKGKKVVAHRVMWPEFNGEKYKLEHLYRGTLQGDTIVGDLLVKEDELPKFEVLRSFTASVRPDGGIVLDGLPLKRVGDAAAQANAPAAEESAPAARPAEAPGLSEAHPPVAAPPAPPTAPLPPAPPALVDAQPSPSSDTPVTKVAAADKPEPEAASLLANIMGSPGSDNLLLVSSRIVVPDAAAELTTGGDALLQQGKPRAALAKYQEAQKQGQDGSALWHRMGRCHLALRHYKKAERLLGRALRLDPGNQQLKADYTRAKKRMG